MSMSKHLELPNVRPDDAQADDEAARTRALITVGTQIETADLKPSTRNVARMLLGKAANGNGYCVTYRRELWRILKKLGPEDGKSIDDIADAPISDDAAWQPVNPISMANDEYADAEIMLCYRRATARGDNDE